MHRRPRRRIFVTTLAIVALLAAAVGVRLYVVPASDGAARADAFVVLGGQNYSARVHTGAGLARRFAGSTLVVSIPSARTCPPLPKGVTKILCFRPDPSTTQGEARQTAALAKQYGWTSITVVTTADQVWRARLRFRRCIPSPVSLLMMRAPSSVLSRIREVPYEAAATVKAEILQRSC